MNDCPASADAGLRFTGGFRLAGGGAAPSCAAWGGAGLSQFDREMGVPFAATAPAAVSTLLINEYRAFHRFPWNFYVACIYANLPAPAAARTGRRPRSTAFRDGIMADSAKEPWSVVWRIRMPALIAPLRPFGTSSAH